MSSGVTRPCEGRWSRGTHWQCPRDVREAVRARAMLLGGRGLPVMNGDMWRLIFSYLIDGEHVRRELRDLEAEMWAEAEAAGGMDISVDIEETGLGACCSGGEAVAPCAACRAVSWYCVLSRRYYPYPVPRAIANT